MTSSAAPTAVRTSLADVVRVVGSWCGQTDPAVLSGAQAASGVEQLAVVIRQLSATQALMAGRAAECNSYSRRSPSPEDGLARANGTSRGEAKKAVDTARRLRSCPATADAFANGELSLGEAEVISAAAVVDPTAEAGLVAKATSSHDLTETRDQAERVKRAARHGEDPVVRRARLRARWRWSEFDDDGMKGVSARFVAEELAVMSPVIDAYAKAHFDQARREGRHEPFEAYRADAVLSALAAAGEAAGLELGTTTKPASARPTTTAADQAASTV
ncbi:MAG: hypothetical protein ACXWA3_19180, partial [Acidimicrobiales bacterium]